MTRSPRPHGCRVCDERFESPLELLFHEMHEHGSAALRAEERRRAVAGGAG